MTTSIVDMFTIGLGPSSSHSVGPMRAAKYFISAHLPHQLETVHHIRVELFGSLGLTGVGHGTGKAVQLGLEGWDPENIDPHYLQQRIIEIEQVNLLNFSGKKQVVFHPTKDIVFHRQKSLPLHPNGLRFTSFDTSQKIMVSKDYYSIGGGFVCNDKNHPLNAHVIPTKSMKYPFKTGKELLEICDETGLSIPKIVLENETVWRSEQETRQYLLKIWSVMKGAIQEGCQTEGVLPGSLKVKRRAASLYKKLKADANSNDPLQALDWVNLYAMAVNEVNAAGGRVVTAPTNGASGIIPAVIKYYRKFSGDKSEDSVVRFLTTAFAIGLLYKENASLSGAEVGCQGEVGVACSMAAAGLTEVRGGTVAQIENAAEIGIEHNLGLTCDPIGGLVQVPCIERNSMGAVKAINSSRIALCGDGKHKVHLDQAIKTMFQTGADMKKKYKETSRGGLAVNVIEC